MPFADLLTQVAASDNIRPQVATLASPGYLIGDTSMDISAAIGWPTTTAIHFVMYETKTVSGEVIKDTTTQRDFKGTLSGTTISDMVLTGGIDRNFDEGAVVEITPTARYARDLYDWGKVEHNEDGTHRNITADQITVDGTIAAPGNNKITVEQTAHGFVVGDVLKSSGTDGEYAKAQADSAENAEVVGIVYSVDTNEFVLATSGLIDKAAAVLSEDAGTVLFLSESSAGALTATEPTTDGQISKPVAIVTTDGAEMQLIQMRGIVIESTVQPDIANPYCFSAEATTASTMTTGTWKKVAFTNELYDYNSDYDATNSKLVISVPGVYHFDAAVTTVRTVNGNEQQVTGIYKNGTEVKRGTWHNHGPNADQWVGTSIVAADVLCAVDDYIEIYTYTDDGENTTGIAKENYFNGHLIHEV